MCPILNPEDFCDSVRKVVLKNYGLPDNEDHLTNNQVMRLLEEKCKKDEDGCLLGDEGSLDMVVEAAQSIVIGRCLSSMAASGELETAWDSEKNEPVFWMGKKT